MNIRLLSALLTLQERQPDPEPTPEILLDLVVPPGWPRAAYAEPWPHRPQVIVLDESVEAKEDAAKVEEAALNLPNFYTPVKGNIIAQAKGPNRAADRARGIYGKRGKK